MIVIINYGMGNLGSIANMLKKAGAQACISSDPSEILQAEKLVLPGVGAFDNGMNNIRELGLIPILNKKVLEERTPLLGICLGMQLLTKKSEEGATDGLGWIDAETIRFRHDIQNGKLKIPHMGWNTITIRKNHAIFEEMYAEPRFYFVHSYHVVCTDPRDVLCSTIHGIEFTSAVQKENIIGVQFHPEKSHKFGLKLMSNFAKC